MMLALWIPLAGHAELAIDLSTATLEELLAARDAIQARIEEIEKDTIDEYILESEKQTALNKTVGYIKSSIKTKKQIRDYLYKKEYSPITIKYVIEKLEEYGYVSDRTYAMSYINTYRNKYGTMRLKGNLIAKGVDKDLVDECILEAMEEDSTSSIDMVASKYLKNKEIDDKTIQKLIRFLSYRGYDFDKINAVVSRLKKGDEWEC